MAAQKQKQTTSVRIEKPTRKRPNRHSKKKTSKLKKSKCYSKKYKGQGR